MERPSEPLRDLPKPFACETATDTDPARDLTKPLLSDPARENETVSVLKSATCSTALEDTVIDPVSALWMEEWLTRFEDMVSEPVKLLKIEECSTRTEVSEPARNSEPVNVLNSEARSVMVVDNPRVPVKNSTRPLDPDVARPSEPVRDLPMPLV